MRPLKQELSSYTVFGILTTLISITTYKVFLSLELPYQLATVMSSVLGIIFAYITNRKYVFKSNNKILNESIKFFTARILTLVLETFLLLIAVSQLGYDDFLAKILVTIIVILLNYILSKFTIFTTSTKEDTF